ncbi:HlyU family transcriptional regulator [Tepidamorphus sp. 3E244]|uniref:HlyU family transcriptional regulator n=1 Tax=Tepidamorphus sp. 3E244 TaxID=3385498 RepID=UPI0038FC7DEE
MSILNRLFGRAKQQAPISPMAADEKEIEGVLVQATPHDEGGQSRLGARLSKEIDGEMRHHTLIRADTFPNREDAIAAAFRKAEALIKEQGDTIFA